MNEVTYGIIQGLPMAVEPAVRVKNYAFFELRWPKRTYNDKEYAGPLVVEVRENKENGNMSVKWYNRNAHMLRWDADDNQIATAWMVDDLAWYNRLFILDQPDIFRVTNYHTRNGTYAGAYIDLEIECMREVMKHQRSIVWVTRNGVPRDWFYDEAQAKTFIKKQAKVVTKLSPEGVVTEESHDFVYDTIPGTRHEYKPEFLQMSKTYKNLPHGWTSCPEFAQRYKPMILEMIADKRRNQQAPETSISKDAIKNTLRSLTLEERQELLGVMPEMPKAEAPEVETVEVPQETAPETPAAISPEAAEPVERKKRSGRPKGRTAGVAK